MRSKKRLLLAAGMLASIGAIVALATGVTFGLFSASASQGTASTFQTGTVTIGTPTEVDCSVTNMVPGDDSAGYSTQLSNITDTPFAACEFQVTYTGSAPAYIGLSTSLTGTLGSSLLWQIAQSATDNSQPGVFATAGVINTNSASDPLYVATDSGGGTYTFWVDYALPRTVTDQTLTAADLTLTVSAVQAGNNGTAASCVVGAQCATTSTGIRSWS